MPSVAAVCAYIVHLGSFVAPSKRGGGWKFEMPGGVLERNCFWTPDAAHSYIPMGYVLEKLVAPNAGRTFNITTHVGFQIKFSCYKQVARQYCLITW